MKKNKRCNDLQMLERRRLVISKRRMYMFGGCLFKTLGRTIAVHIQKIEWLDDVQSQGYTLWT